MRPELPCDIEDRYTVVAELGRGSHAIVYQAHDRVLGRDVAIKVLREELVDSQVSERFRREIRLTSRLDHPHIAHVYGTGEWQGAPYFVIALARGPSLAERLTRERQLPVDDALAITRDVAAALSHAHQAEIVHRDVKPANILLTPDGALLTDFGVARAVESSAATLATSTGTAVGTLLYMSPEQLCAEKDIDARSDQYSLALVLYEMLAGVPAHTAANAEGLRALRIVGQHAPLRTHRPSVSPVVESAIDRALSPTPADRFHTMAEFVAAIDGTTVSNSWRVSASHVTTVPSASGPTRRAWAKPVAIAGALLAIGASATALWWPPAEGAAPTREALAVASSFAIRVVGDTADGAPVARRLAEELRAWNGITADVGTAEGVPLELRVATVPGGASVSVALAGARRVQVRLASASAPDPDSLRMLAARVLMATVVSPDSAETITWVSDRRVTAVRTFGQAWVALLDGSLAEAEQRFADAARADAVPQAVLWSAIVSSWRRPKAPASWVEAARRAKSMATNLSPHDALLAEGLASRMDLPVRDACAPLRTATQLSGGTFPAWYGLARCLSVDSAVVRDSSSPTRWRFRAAHWTTVRAYEEAIRRLPSPHLASLFAELPTVALAVNGMRRLGVSITGSEAPFVGLPSLSGDSVVVLPIREASMIGGDVNSVPVSYQTAVRRGRTRLLELTKQLANQAPESFEVQLALARAFEYAGVNVSPKGEASATTVLHTARRLARTGSDTIAVGVAGVRVMLRLADFGAAKNASLELLRFSDTAAPKEAETMAGVAALMGRVADSESLLIRANTVTPTNPDGLPRSVAIAHARYALSSFTASCLASDSARVSLVRETLEQYAPRETAGVLRRWAHPVDWMRLSCPHAIRPDEEAAQDPLLRAFALLRRGDASAAAEIIRGMESGRDGVAGSSLAWDSRFAEAHLLLQAGDSSGAKKQLAAAFNDLSGSMDLVLFDLSQVAGFRRSIHLCGALRWNENEARIRSRCQDAIVAFRI